MSATKPDSTSPGRVGRVARVLGFAGLLPPVAFVALIAHARGGIEAVPTVLLDLADLYAAIILSFVGGMWWSFALRRTHGKGALAGVAVTPSLVGLALLLGGGLVKAGWASVALGCAILLTLLVDRHLATRGEAPAGWMILRVPLSLGLGLLTIAAGVLGCRSGWACA